MTAPSLKSPLLSILFLTSFFNAFAQTNGDERMKIRLGFSSANQIHRQILVTEDSNATAGIDFGYDAESFENHPDDMYWMIGTRTFLIQGINIINQDSALPLGLHTATDGVSTISIDELINVPEALEIAIFDNNNNSYHNIKGNSGFTIDLPAGIYLNRFELRFLNNNEDSTSNEEEEIEVEIETEAEAEENITEIEANNETQEVVGTKLKLQFFNNTKSIKINNPNSQTITSVEIFNLNGQLKTQYNLVTPEHKIVIQTNNLSKGTYILVLNTESKRLSKKILIK
ncbi:T9SS type A sorting domain-containing protein [uncultured Lacinutrix sp.]|uniref:T9SS type A sorting domain-containing protein n=1 Tax=uncultured Lacinutrix sp. TaxID=574032 RepID=UPI00263A018E|nr:T9SS type A sorting domain-containing protein [uncultured Lacinutrix sp.]